MVAKLLCKWRHLVGKFATMQVVLFLNLIQVTESISGSVVPLAMFITRVFTTGLKMFHFPKCDILI